MNLITPEILKGTRDFLPPQMAKRQYVMQKITNIFERFGYDTIETPAIEYAKTLLGEYGDEGNKLTYKFTDNGGRDIALIYDQTVPFARLVAANYRDLPMPFKRYQISRVWRADKPAKGRYREFYQCDIDIIGTKTLLAEAEVAKVITAIFKELKLADFVIQFNSRRFLNSVLEDLKIKDQAAVIRILDKLEKIGKDGIREELKKLIDDETTNKLLEILLEEKLDRYDTSEITKFKALAKQLGVPEKNLLFKPTLARGLDYYTGIVYEVYLPNVDIGAVCAGGRYDNLCGRFCKEKFSGVGVAFGFDRIVLAMEELGLLEEINLNSKVLVTNFSEETLPYSLAVLNSLQESLVNSEVYFEPTKLNKQFKYADKKQIPFVITCGPEEIKSETVTVKIMKTGKQKTIPKNQLTSYLNGYENCSTE